MWLVFGVLLIAILIVADLAARRLFPRTHSVLQVASEVMDVVLLLLAIGLVLFQYLTGHLS